MQEQPIAEQFGQIIAKAMDEGMTEVEIVAEVRRMAAMESDRRTQETARKLYGPKQAEWERHTAECPARAGSVYYCECGADPTRARGVEPHEYDEDAVRCPGHPAGPVDPMGETVYCDGSCQS